MGVGLKKDIRVFRLTQNTCHGKEKWENKHTLRAQNELYAVFGKDELLLI